MRISVRILNGQPNSPVSTGRVAALKIPAICSRLGQELHGLCGKTSKCDTKQAIFAPLSLVVDIRFPRRNGRDPVEFPRERFVLRHARCRTVGGFAAPRNSARKSSRRARSGARQGFRATQVERASRWQDAALGALDRAAQAPGDDGPSRRQRRPFLVQSSAASSCTAGFLNLSQSPERPER